MSMKIYFAGSIRGGVDDLDIYTSIIEKLDRYGEVHSDHGQTHDLNQTVEQDRELYRQDMAALAAAQVVVAEVTQPSLGVGYQIGQAQCLGKSILGLYRQLPDRQVSAMMTGNDAIDLQAYTNMSDIDRILEGFFAELTSQQHDQ